MGGQGRCTGGNRLIEVETAGIRMKLIPYETLTINTSLHPEEALHKLQAVIEPKRIFRWWLSAHKPYEGVINGDQFTVSRILGYRNSFKPIIHGKIQHEINGCSIRITLSLDRLVILIMAIWFGLVFISFLSFLVNFIGSATPEGKWQPNVVPSALISIGMLAFGYGLMMGGFIFEAAKSKAFFRKLFKQC